VIVLAGEGRAILQVTTGSTAATAVAVTNSGFRGRLYEVTFDVPSATACTGATMVVTSKSDITTEAARTLASTNGAAADVVMFPRYAGSDPDGTGATTDKPWMYMAQGESLIFTVTGATSTGAVVKAILKYIKED
jgi:hypothetical protein